MSDRIRGITLWEQGAMAQKWVWILHSKAPYRRIMYWVDRQPPCFSLVRLMRTMTPFISSALRCLLTVEIETPRPFAKVLWLGLHCPVSAFWKSQSSANRRRVIGLRSGWWSALAVVSKAILIYFLLIFSMGYNA